MSDPRLPVDVLTALRDKWLEKARRARPLESAPLTVQKRLRVREWMLLTQCAAELAALIPDTGTPPQDDETTTDSSRVDGQSELPAARSTASED